jgi:hypothetical protein
MSKFGGNYIYNARVSVVNLAIEEARRERRKMI